MPGTKSMASVRARIKETQDALLRAKDPVTQPEHHPDELNHELDEAQVRAVTAALKKKIRPLNGLLFPWVKSLRHIFAKS